MIPFIHGFALGYAGAHALIAVYWVVKKSPQGAQVAALMSIAGALCAIAIGPG
jgi:hypothetical protein